MSKQIDYITVQDIYQWARQRRLLDARIRICDGMAVSYYPDPRSLHQGRFEVVIDVSALNTFEYDELDTYAQRVDEHAPQIDDQFDLWAREQYTRDRHLINPRKDISNEEYKRQLRAIAGYGYTRK